MAHDIAIIMVVDDQVDFVEGIKLVLDQEGYGVWTAFNGQEALEQLLDHANNAGLPYPKPLPTLILAEIMMPIMDGYALYEHTQSDPRLKHIPFIFLTAKTSDEDLEYGKNLGVEDYLTKPCVPDVLLASVRGQLKHGQPQFQPQLTPVNLQEDVEKSSNPMLLVGVGIMLILVIIIISGVEIPWT